MEISRILHTDAKEFIKGEKDLIVGADLTYYGLFVENKLVSVTGLKETDNAVRLKANYTPPAERKKGYFSVLLKYVAALYPGKRVEAHCLEASHRIYLRQGFRLKQVKACKAFKLYYVEKLPSEG